MKKNSFIIPFLLFLLIPLHVRAAEPEKKTVKVLVATIKETNTKNNNIAQIENKFMRYGNVVRYAQGEGTDNEYMIFDFNKMKTYRIFPRDKIYFESLIENKFRTHKARNGEISFTESPNIELTKIQLGERVLNGLKCNIVIVVRSFKDKARKNKGLPSEYTLMWEAVELDNSIIRSEYVHLDYSRTLIEFIEPHYEDLPADMFSPPAGFASLSPF